VTYNVRLTAEAVGDLDRLDACLLVRDLDAAERALELLAHSPFSCRKALLQNNPRWRELTIPCGHAGFVALFEINDADTVTLCAPRYQREEDYH
jgi:hypothetical protein